jgi:riboflavin kinase / FMN adenylyltransferase
MELIRGLKSLKPRHRGTVASIGNFDGVHLGHRAVLRELGLKAREFGVPATAVVFQPMPQEYFARERAPARLTRFGEKWPLLAAAGVDRVLCLRFGRELAQMAPEAFIEEILVQGLGVKHLAVGDDFRFGRERRGDFAMLQQAGAAQGFKVADTASLMLEGSRVSSSRIRALLIEGDMQGAARLLGRPYSLSGRVMYGEQLGRKLGFPTANMALMRHLAPVGGIFAARVHGLGDAPHDATAYVGHRPAVDGTQTLLETHLLDFSGDIYGRKLEVELLQRLREDRHFDSLDALTDQMQKDVQAARAWLADHKT